MSEEKRKNEDISNRRWDMLFAGSIGFCSGVPVAAWLIGHLFYARVDLAYFPGGSIIELLPGLLSALDCFMAFCAFFFFTSSVYALGVKQFHKDIIAELEKPQ